MSETKKKETQKLEIKTRKPEKRGIFDNLGIDRPKDRHPLSEILNFPSEITDNSNLEIQESNIWISKDPKDRYPNDESLDIQNNLAGYPIQEKLDIQVEKSGEIGYPKDESLDILISKDGGWISKNEESLDIKISKEKSLDIQKTQKTSKWKKYEKTRSRKGIFLRTEDDITKRFKQFCIAQEIDFSQGTELAWEKFMTDLDIHTSESLDIKISLNNKQLIILSKTKSSIINLYCEYNQFFTSKIRWSAKDDRTGKIYNEVDLRIIELGIIQTQCNLIAEGDAAKTSINGFQYYTNEIKKFMMYEDQPEILDTILKINRSAWLKTTGKIVDYAKFEESQA